MTEKQTVQVPKIHIRDYTYDLPEDRIAKHPLPERDRSKLLVWENGEISESVFSDLDHYLSEGSLLISNNTKVIHARLNFRRPGGAKIEVFCLEPFSPSDYQLAFRQTGEAEWRCMVGNAKKWKNGPLEKSITIADRPVLLRAEKKGAAPPGYIIRLSWDSDDTFASIIDAAGQIPIPPYLKRPAENSDYDRYQTIYALTGGSVAAPTAGLHFTEKVLNRLKEKKITVSELTLHVGAGTFQPVKSEEIAGHAMHNETVIVSRKMLQQLNDHPGKIFAVGTTSVRSLESLYWLGLSINSQDPLKPLHVGQWQPYTEEGAEEPKASLRKLAEYLDRNKLDELTFTTSVIIVPGYRFMIIDGMITNFHQPASTLLLLIAAFIGSHWKKVYDYALTNGFRFLSYGDSNLYLKPNPGIRSLK